MVTFGKSETAKSDRRQNFQGVAIQNEMPAKANAFVEQEAVQTAKSAGNRTDKAKVSIRIVSVV